MIKAILPSYLYQQYTNNDTTPYLQAFFDAYNELSQTNLDTLNSLNLPDYTTKTGALLDLVGTGIYGIPRPTFSLGTYSYLGEYDTVPYDTLAYNSEKLITPSNFYVTNDDYYKRIITWNYYEGDGNYFNTTWLKRRIQRFLQGVNGYLPVLDNTYQISVTFASLNVIDIIIATGNLTASAPILNAGIQAGVLQLPFQYTYNVTY
jgi:hypothetical protein